MDQTTQLRQLIRESIQEYIREVETSGNIAAQEAKIKACEEAIALRERKVALEGIDETMHEMIDQSKINLIKKEIKDLQKYLAKATKTLEKMRDKAEGKMAPKKMEDEGMNEETEEGMVDEVNLDEYTSDPAAGPELEEARFKKGTDIGKKGKGFAKIAKSAAKEYGSKEAGQRVAGAILKKVLKKEEVETEGETLNESFLHMQKLAGLITETQYKEKMQILNEEYTPPAYEAINDLMDSINMNTGTKGDIVPYRSISWLPSVSDEDGDMDMLVYKKGKYEIAIGADDVYQSPDEEDSKVWIIDSNDPNVDFGEHMTFDEAENAASEWLKS